MPHLHGNSPETHRHSLRTPLLVLLLLASWQCIYHWLRSNQEYLTCPLCKSGLELSSVRPILCPNEAPEKGEGGVPPRPRACRRARQAKKLDSVPRTITAMGMNVQRGVMIAGYGIFPSCFQSLFHNFREPEPSDSLLSGSTMECKIYRWMKIGCGIFLLLAILFLLLG